MKRSRVWDGDQSQKFSGIALASEAGTSLLILRGVQARHCHSERQEDKKRWEAREDLGIPREGRGGDA